MGGDSPRIEELRRRVQSDPASIAFAALAEEYRRAGRYDEAVETCRTGLQRHPSYLSAHVTLGRALLEVGRFEEAQQELEFVLKQAPENLAAIRGLAEIHHRRGDDAPAPAAPPIPIAPSPAQPAADIRLKPASAAAPPIDLQLNAIVPPPPAPQAPVVVVAAAAPDAGDAPPESAALAGLEAFLAAIARARAQRRAGSR